MAAGGVGTREVIQRDILAMTATWRRSGKMFRDVLVAAVILWTLLIAVAVLFQRRLIYFPDNLAGEPTQFGLPGGTRLWLAGSDGVRLDAWLVPPTSKGVYPHRALLYLHGNGGSVAERAPWISLFAAEGLAVLAVDWRGYGASTGSPSEAGLTDDAETAFKALLERGYRRDEIVVFGESLGTALAISVALDQHPLALVLDTPFSSMTAIGAVKFPWLPVRWALFDRYEVLENARRLTLPILVVRASEDTVIPKLVTDELIAALPKTRIVKTIGGRGHPAMNLGAANLVAAWALAN